MKSGKIKIIIIAVKVLLSVMIGALVLYNIDSVKLENIVKNADISFIILACALLPLNLYLQFAKWKYLVDRTSAVRVPAIQIWESVILGISFGFITPGRVGELGKLIAIEKTDRYKLLGMSILEKLYDTFPVIFFGIISAIFLPELFFSDSALMKVNMLIFALLILFSAYYVAVHPGILRTLLNYFRHKVFKQSVKFSRFTDSLHGFKKGSASVLLLFSILLFLIYTTQFVFLILAFGEISILHAFLGVWLSILLKTFLPFSIGDIGIREGTAAYIFAIFNFPAEAAVSAAFMLFVINILIPSAAGIFTVPFIKNFISENGN
jgi:uncharacterized protein (TIRG00374 family)